MLPVPYPQTVSYRAQVMYATSCMGLWVVESWLHFSGAALLLSPMRGQVRDLLYMCCVHLLAESFDLPLSSAIVGVGFWVIGISFWPVDDRPKPLEHVVVLAANAGMVHLLQSNLASLALVLRFLWALRERPGMLTMNPISIIISLATAWAVCLYAAGAFVGHFAPFLTAYCFATSYRFADQFVLEQPAPQPLAPRSRPKARIRNTKGLRRPQICRSPSQCPSRPSSQPKLASM